MDIFIKFISKQLENRYILIVVGFIIGCFPYVLLTVKKLSQSKRSIVNMVIFLLFSLCIMLILGIISIDLVHLIFNKDHDGFMGNFIGGVIGAIVALLIASYQSNKSLRIHKMEKLQKTKTILSSLLSEFEMNISLIDTLERRCLDNRIKSENEISVDLSAINNEIWQVVKLPEYLMDTFTAEEYSELSKLYMDLKILSKEDLCIKLGHITNLKNRLIVSRNTIDNKLRMAN